MLTFMILLAYGLGLFYIGHKWGDLVIEQFRAPGSHGRIFPGQRWKIPGVGEVIIYDVWPETVTYYKASSGSERLSVMNRPDFEAGARDMSGRDAKGRFRGTPETRVLKFEVKNGGQK